MIQIKTFRDEIKPLNNGLLITYDTDRKCHERQINDEESRRTMDLVAHQADRAWDDIDEEAGGRTLEVTISMLINQTLAYYIRQLHGTKVPCL